VVLLSFPSEGVDEEEEEEEEDEELNERASIAAVVMRMSEAVSVLADASIVLVFGSWSLSKQARREEGRGSEGQERE
jgi:hypothetical protein